MKKVFAIVALLASVAVCAATAIPPLNGQWVIDTTKTLSKQQIDSISTKADGIAKSTGSVAVVLLTNSTNGENIDEYAMRVAETWHPGKAGIDQAAVLVIAKADRKLAIKTTRQTGILYTDTRTKNTLELMKPALRQGNYNDAIVAFYNDASKYLVPDKISPPVVPPVAVAKQETDDSFWVYVYLITGLVVAFSGFMLYRIWQKTKREAELRAAQIEQAEQREHERNMATARAAAAAIATTPILGGMTPEPYVNRTRPSNKTVTKPTISTPVRPATARTTPAYRETTVVPIAVPVPSSSSRRDDDDDSYSRRSSSSSSSSYSGGSSWSSSDSSSSSSSFDGGGSSSDY